MVIELNKTRFKILNNLLDIKGENLSISELTKSIKKKYGSGNYSLINEELHKMADEKLVYLEKIGHTLVPKLNFDNQNLITLLVKIELDNKLDLLNKFPQLQPIISLIENNCQKLHYIHSISIINAKQNKKLNRVELLIIFRPKELDENWDYNHDLHLRKEKEKIKRILQSLGTKYNIRIDYLILDRAEYLELVQSDEINQVGDMLKTKIVIFRPQIFWFEYKDIIDNYFKNLKLYNKKETETNPSFISEQELTYNLARFGYIEFGSNTIQTDNISIEYIITAILIRNDIRKLESIPIIILKNMNSIHIELLKFLCIKYGVLDKLLYIIETMKYNNLEKLELYNVLSSSTESE